MTRKECEKAVMEKLLEIRKILIEYSDETAVACMSAGRGTVSAFRIIDKSNPEKPVYDLDTFKYFD